MMWRPEPRSCRRFEPDTNHIHIRADPDMEISRRHLVVSSAFAAFDNPAPDAFHLREAIREVTEGVRSGLIEIDHVADFDDYRLIVTVRAELSAWPAVAFITVP
jgi:hypothetical protein